MEALEDIRIQCRRFGSADLENGTTGFATASGMAATGSILELLDAGSHVVAGDDLYGGTYRIFENVRKRSAGQ